MRGEALKQCRKSGTRRRYYQLRHGTKGKYGNDFMRENKGEKVC